MLNEEIGHLTKDLDNVHQNQAETQKALLLKEEEIKNLKEEIKKYEIQVVNFEERIDDQSSSNVQQEALPNSDAGHRNQLQQKEMDLIAHKAEIEDHKATIDHLQRQIRQEKDAHHESINTIKEMHFTEVKRLEKEKQDVKAKFELLQRQAPSKTDHDKKIIEISNEHEERLARVRDDYEYRLMELQQAHETEMQRLQVNHEDELATIKDEADVTVEHFKAMNAQPDSLNHLVDRIHRDGIHVLSLSELAIVEQQGRGEIALQAEIETLHRDFNKQKSSYMTIIAEHESAAKILEAKNKDLLAQIGDLKAQLEDDEHRHSLQMTQIKTSAAQRERELISEKEVIEHHYSKESTLKAEIQDSIEAERAHNMTLSQDLARERTNTKSLQNEINQLHQHVDSLENEIQESRKRVTSLTAALEDERSRTKHLRESLQNEKRRNESEEAKENATIQNLRHEITVITNQRNKIQHDLEIETNNLARLKQQLEEDRSSYYRNEKNMKNHISDLTEELQSFRASYEALNDELDHERRSRSEIHIQTESHKASAQQLETRLEEERARNAGLSASLDAEKRRYKTLMNSMDAERSEMKRELDQRNATIRDQLKRIGDSEQQLVELRIKLENETRELIKAEDDCERIKDDLKRCQERISEMDRQIQQEYEMKFRSQKEFENLENELKSSRSELQALKVSYKQVEYELSENQKQMTSYLHQYDNERKQNSKRIPELEKQIHDRDAKVERLLKQITSLEHSTQSLTDELHQINIQHQTLKTKSKNTIDNVLQDHSVQLQDKEEEIQAVHARVQHQELKMNDLQNQVKHLTNKDERTVRQFNLDMADKEKEIKSHQRKISDLQTSVVSLTNELRDKEHEHEHLKRAHIDQSSEFNSLHQQLTSVKEHFEELQSTCDHLESERRRLLKHKDDNADTLEVVERLNEIVRTKDSELETLHKKTKRFDNIISDLEAQVTHLTKNNEETVRKFNFDMGEKEKEIKHYKATISELEQHKSASAGIERLNQLLKNKDHEIEQLRSRCENIEELFSQKQSQVNDMHQTLEFERHTRSQDEEADHQKRIGYLDGYRRQIETLRQKLELVVVQLKDLRGSASERNALTSLFTELQNLQETLAQPEIRPLQKSPQHQFEKIREHNEHLSTLIDRISDEKQELRETIARLEDRNSNEYDVENIIQAERSQWLQERHQLEDEIHDLKSQVRHLEAENRSSLSTAIAPSGADTEKIQKLYGHFLRAESFRKNLVYQKKYLFAIIGEFRDTEAMTTRALCILGQLPRDTRKNPNLALQRFKGVARAVIAVTRMKFLMKKWKRVKKASSTGTLSPPTSARSEVKVTRRVATSNYPPPAPSASSSRTSYTVSRTPSNVEDYRDVREGSYSRGSHQSGRSSRSESPMKSRSGSDDLNRQFENLQQKLGNVNYEVRRSTSRSSSRQQSHR